MLFSAVPKPAMRRGLRLDRKQADDVNAAMETQHNPEHHLGIGSPPDPLRGREAATPPGGHGRAR